MAWLQKLLVQLALSRPAETLIKESGGEPRTVRGMTLDPRIQFLEANARKRAIPWENQTVANLRQQTTELRNVFGGRKVGGVRTERIYITGRSHSVPARLYLPTVRNNSAAMLVYYHFGGGVVGVLENCERLCSLIAKEAGCDEDAAMDALDGIDGLLACAFVSTRGYFCDGPVVHEVHAEPAERGVAARDVAQVAAAAEDQVGQRA